MNAPPMAFQWDGETMVPRSARAADERYVIGQVYMLEEHQDRSSASHAHYFACLRDAWLNLPEDQAARFPSAEHLRKWALIRAGFRDERTIVCANNIEAVRAAAFVGEVTDFAIVAVNGPMVVIHTPKSQSMRAMGKADFQASKDAVLEVLAEMLGVETGELTAQAGKAA